MLHMCISVLSTLITVVHKHIVSERVSFETIPKLTCMDKRECAHTILLVRLGSTVLMNWHVYCVSLTREHSSTDVRLVGHLASRSLMLGSYTEGMTFVTV